MEFYGLLSKSLATSCWITGGQTQVFYSLWCYTTNQKVYELLHELGSHLFKGTAYCDALDIFPNNHMMVHKMYGVRGSSTKCYHFILIYDYLKLVLDRVVGIWTRMILFVMVTKSVHEEWELGWKCQHHKTGTRDLTIHARLQPYSLTSSFVMHNLFFLFLPKSGKRFFCENTLRTDNAIHVLPLKSFAMPKLFIFKWMVAWISYADVSDVWDNSFREISFARMFRLAVQNMNESYLYATSVCPTVTAFTCVRIADVLYA